MGRNRAMGTSRVASGVDKPLAHIIGIKAVNIFKNALPPEDWTPYDIGPDYRKDNKVELVDGGRHAGVCFWVQLKGMQKVVRLRDGTVSFGLDTKDLDYFVKLTVPIFLFVIDVTQGSGNWIFLQGYERSVLREKDWWRRKEIQIHLPAANTLSDFPRLRAHVRQAHRFMIDREFRKGLLEETRRLESIDPRFRAKVTVGLSGQNYSFETDEPIQFDVAYKGGDPASGKVEDLLDRGRSVTFQRGEIEIKGLPLLDDLIERLGAETFRLQFNRSAEGTARLLRKDALGDIQGTLEAIPCKIIYGKSNVRFEASLPDDLLAITMDVTNANADRGPMTLNIDLTKWLGRRLMELPAFDAIDRIFGSLRIGERIGIECYLTGHHLLSGALDPTDDAFLAVIRVFLGIVRKARSVALMKGINPVVTDEICSPSSVADIKWLHDVLVGDGHKDLFKGSLTMTVGRGGMKKFLRDIKGPMKPGLLESTCDASIPFLGEIIIIESLRQKFSDVRLKNRVSSLQEALKSNPLKKDFKMTWLATNSCILTSWVRSSGEQST